MPGVNAEPQRPRQPAGTSGSRSLSASSRRWCAASPRSLTLTFHPHPHLSPFTLTLTFHPHPNPNQDIGASNAGLTLLSVSFHTVIRGAIPGLVLIFALIAGLEKPEVTHLPPSSPRHPPSLCPSAPASVDPRYLRRDTRARDTRARDTP